MARAKPSTGVWGDVHAIVRLTVVALCSIQQRFLLSVTLGNLQFGLTCIYLKQACCSRRLEFAPIFSLKEFTELLCLLQTLLLPRLDLLRPRRPTQTPTQRHTRRCVLPWDVFLCAYTGSVQDPWRRTKTTISEAHFPWNAYCRLQRIAALFPLITSAPSQLSAFPTATLPIQSKRIVSFPFRCLYSLISGTFLCHLF